MSELVKCQCGAGPIRYGLHTAGHQAVGCLCGILVERLTLAEAIAAWNALMRPRPVAEWQKRNWGRCDDLRVGALQLGWIAGDYAGFQAHDCLRDERSPLFPDLPSARAWLEERVRAAGIDVKEEPRG